MAHGPLSNKLVWYGGGVLWLRGGVFINVSKLENKKLFETFFKPLAIF